MSWIALTANKASEDTMQHIVSPGHTRTPKEAHIQNGTSPPFCSEFFGQSQS